MRLRLQHRALEAAAFPASKPASSDPYASKARTHMHKCYRPMHIPLDPVCATGPCRYIAALEEVASLRQQLGAAKDEIARLQASPPQGTVSYSLLK